MRKRANLLTARDTMTIIIHTGIKSDCLSISISLSLHLFISLSLYFSISLSQTIKYRDEICILSWITCLMFQLWWVSHAPWPTSFRIYKSWWQSLSDSTSLPWYKSLWVWWKLWKLFVDQNIITLDNAYIYDILVFLWLQLTSWEFNHTYLSLICVWIDIWCIHINHFYITISTFDKLWVGVFVFMHKYFWVV